MKIVNVVQSVFVMFCLVPMGRASVQNTAQRCAPDRIDWASAQELPVNMAEYRFEPSDIKLKACQPYHLILTNQGQSDHNFSSPAFFKQMAVRDEGSGAMSTPTFGEIEVKKGQQASLMFVSTASGKYDLKCTHFLHASHGMKGTIEVSE